MTIYRRSRKPFDPALFAEPTADYRGAPFWSWNNTLDREQLFRQLECLRQMGFGGAHIHCRTGMGTPYLGKEFLDIVRASAEHARKLGMLTWLYDEDRWPSGFAGGLVTRDVRHRAKHLLLTKIPYGRSAVEGTANESAMRSSRTGNGQLVAVYEVILNPEGELADYRRIASPEAAAPNARQALWYAYLETATPTDWFNRQTYVDTLSPAAIRKFVQVTHEAYRRAVGDMFGKEIPAIFTDEPQFAHKHLLNDPHEAADVVLPWTTDLPETFRKAYGDDLLERLPEVVWELPDGQASLTRYRYHDHVAERFASAFADTVGSWCRAHGIALTGHMMEEPSLTSQTNALGEAMRSYRAFDIPGIDMLCDWREYTTAKQAQSAAHQYGRPGVMSELYGVTGWHFDFAGHKGQGDWQAALGVTLRVPHLAWVSMAGEAKRDYPAAISQQSPWFAEYPLIEDHFARVNVAMTRGRPHVRVGVIHPIESFWLCYGPYLQTRAQRDQREEQFRNLTEWLLFGTIDFDFVCESLLPSQTPASAGGKAGAPTLGVGQMRYEAVVVPGMRTIRGTTLDRLEAFADAGGQVIFAGEIPSLVDAMPSDRAERLAGRATRVPMEKVALLGALETCRDLRVTPGYPGWWGEERADLFSLLYQMREDGPNRYLFVCNTDRQRGRPGTVLEFRGQWRVALLDTLTGQRERVAASYQRGWTRLVWDTPAHGSLLLELTPGRQVRGRALRQEAFEEVARIEGPVPVSLSEPNVLLLDQAQWRVNGGAWQPLEEILRLDNLAREQLGLPQRGGHMAQPWTDRAKDPVVGELELRFAIHSEVEVAAPQLALEEPEAAEIALDGVPVSSEPTGYFVDEAIKTVALPPIGPGTHELSVRIAMTRKRNVEWCYLLGDFGVKVEGRYARLIAPVRQLAWGDWTTQGLPFYAGNITYHCTLPEADGPLALETPKFKAPVMAVALDGKRVGTIGLAPFRVDLPRRGKGRLDVTAFGNRANAFGIVHNTNEHLRWYGPQAWRSTGDGWAYEYQLKPMGILTAPIVKRPSSR